MGKRREMLILSFSNHPILALLLRRARRSQSPQSRHGLMGFGPILFDIGRVQKEVSVSRPMET